MKHLSPLKLIRQNCLECSGGSANEVSNCVIPDCKLYPLRFGTNPNRQGIGRRCHSANADLLQEAQPMPEPEEIEAKTPSHGGGNDQGTNRRVVPGSTTCPASRSRIGQSLNEGHHG
jgi:hypothetical protein